MMKQKKQVSILGTFFLAISAVVLLIGCVQDPNNGDPNKGDPNGVESSFAPFIGSKDQTLWEYGNDKIGYRIWYVAHGKVYEVSFDEHEKVDMIEPIGKVTNGKIERRDPEYGTTFIQSAKIEDEKLTLGKDALILYQVTNLVLIKNVKKALEES